MPSLSRFIFWGMAYLTLYPGKARWAGAGRSTETLLNYAFIIFGFYVLVAGTYVSCFVSDIKAELLMFM
jgi:hypothetical protein